MKRRIIAIALSLSMILSGNGTIAMGAGSVPDFESKIDTQDLETETNHLEETKTSSTEDGNSQNDASVVPTQEELLQWKEDGTLQKKIDFMKSLGMYKASLKNFAEEAIDTIDLDEGHPTIWTGGMPTTGDVKSLVFLVDFPDMPNDGTSPEDVKNMLFSEEDTESPEYPYESLSAYYKRSSYGKLNISGEVYGWLTMKNNREHYNGEDSEQGRQEIIQEILEAYDNQIDFSKYDSDQDGLVDSIYIYYAGGTESWGTQWWSYVVANQDAHNFADGMKIKQYCFFGDMSKITAIHETGHLLGLPDYYDADAIEHYFFNYNGEAGGLGYFDMMDHNIGDHNIFSKMLLGWVDTVFLTEDTELELYPAISEKAQAVIVMPNKDKNIFSDYYILEYYQQKENNINSVFSDGAVKIYHVDASLDEEGINFLNDNSYTEHKLIKLLESDGTEENGQFSYPIDARKYYTESMEFGINTFPTSDLYQGTYSGIQIKIGKITEESAHISVSFKERDEKGPVFTGKVLQQKILKKINQMRDFCMYFDSQIYAGDAMKKIKLTDEDGKEIAVEADILNPRKLDLGNLEAGTMDTKDRYNILVLNSEVLKNGKNYQLLIPANAVKDSFGNGNEEISYQFSTGKEREGKELVDLDDVRDETYNGFCGSDNILLEDHSIMNCQLYETFLAAEKDKAFRLVFRKYTQEGTLLLKQELHITDMGASMRLYHVYQMDENKLLVLLICENPYYLIVDMSNGSYVLDKIFDYVLTNASDHFFTKENKEDIICLGLCGEGGYVPEQSKLVEYEMVTFNKINGDIQKKKIELLYGFSWNYYNENLELDYSRFEKYANIDNSQIRLFKQKNDVMPISNSSFVPTRFDSEGIFWTQEFQKVNTIHYFVSFGTFTQVNVREAKLEILDDDFKKVMDIGIADEIGGFGFVQLFPLQEQGYIAVVPMATYVGDPRKEILYLDSEFNVLWQSRVNAPGFIENVIVSDEKINFFTSHSWIQIENDRNSIEYFSEDKTEFASGIENIAIDKDSKTITLKKKMTAGDLKALVTGNASHIVVYDDQYGEVKKDTEQITAGLMKITSPDEVYSYYYQIVFDSDIEDILTGDVNGDKEINSADALIVLKIAAKLNTPTAEQEKAADVDQNGKVDSADALLILKYAAKLITEFS